MNIIPANQLKVEHSREEITNAFCENLMSKIQKAASDGKHKTCFDAHVYIEVLEELLATCTVQYVIKIVGDEVYVNDKLCCFSTVMDKENLRDDLCKKAIVALADEMGYEATFLFEEMAYRLEEMLDEIEEEE